MGEVTQPYPCIGPYILATLSAAEEAGLGYLEAFAREQYDRHRYGGVYNSWAFGPDVMPIAVPACRYCEASDD